MSIIFAGNPDGPHLRKEEPVWKRGVGWQTRQTWEGTARAIKASVPTWIVDADSVELDLDGLVGTAYVTYAKDIVGNPDATVTPEAEAEITWELQGNDVVKDIFEHRIIKNAEEIYQKEFKTQLANWDAGIAYSILDLTDDLANMFSIAIHGGRQYIDHQWVIRKTTTVPRSYSVSISVAGVNKLWTTRDLPGISGMVLMDAYAVATAFQYPDGEAPAGYYLSWLKKTPSVTRTSSGRFQMIEEWVLDYWSFTDEDASPVAVGLYEVYTP